MTPSIVEVLSKLPEVASADTLEQDSNVLTLPSLDSPEVGKPIAHSQIIELWRDLKSSESSEASVSLEQLLRGSHVYIPPPPPKPEPSPEYKALMARLRRDEEARSYERMVNRTALPMRDSFNQRFPNHSSASAFAAVNQPASKEDVGDDDVTYNDVHRQVMLILNFAVSILGVAGTLWVAARWWSVPARLFLTMGGAAVVAVAEVSVYSIYVWKMGDAKKKQATVKEIKEVVETWVVGKDKGDTTGQGEDDSVLLKEKDSSTLDAVRKRLATGKHLDT